MALPTLWIIRLFTFIGLFALSTCRPLNIVLDSSLPVTSNQARASTIPDLQFDTVKRADLGLQDTEQKLTRDIVTEINAHIRLRDVVWYVGNSGR